MFEATGIILAGGAGSRLKGMDKTQLTINNGPLIENAVDLLREEFAEVLIVTNGHRHYEFPSVKVVVDEKPNCGPLMGLFTGLKASGYDINLVLACDMPFVSRPLLWLMMKEPDSYGVVVPIANGYHEPLLAVYHKRTLPVIKKYLDQNQHKMVSFFDEVNVLEIPEVELRQVDPKLDNFVNINTPEDLQAAKMVVNTKLTNSP